MQKTHYIWLMKVSFWDGRWHWWVDESNFASV